MAIYTIKKFMDTHIPKMRKYSNCMVIMLIDFDKNEDRRHEVEAEIPEPEDLKNDVKKNFEKIGEDLAKDCAENQDTLWSHPLLKHNRSELERTIVSVKPFLFE